MIIEMNKICDMSAIFRKVKTVHRDVSRAIWAGQGALDSFLEELIGHTFVDVWSHWIRLHLRLLRFVFDAASAVEHREAFEELEIERGFALGRIRHA